MLKEIKILGVWGDFPYLGILVQKHKNWHNLG